MLWIPPKRTLAEQFPRGNFASLADLLSRGLNSLVNRIVWEKFPCCGRQSNPSDAGGAASQARDSCRLDRNQLTRGQPIEVSRTGCILLIRYCGFCASSRGHSYGGAPSAQGSRALDRGRDAISAVGRQSIAGSSAGNRTVPSKRLHEANARSQRFRQAV